MACLGAKWVLLLALCFPLFGAGKGQLPQWFGQLNNSNNTNLFKQINANTSFSDLIKRVNSTANGQRMVENFIKRLGNVNFASLLEDQVMQGLRNIPLGQCGHDLQQITRNNMKMISYLDAAGKPQSGLMFGNLYWGVSAEQCHSLSNSHVCRSVFTLAVPTMNLYVPRILWSGCFPVSCTAENVSAILSVVQKQVPELTNNTVYMIHHRSDCPTSPGYDTGAICSLAFCGILLLCCLLGTILEIIKETYESSDQQNTDANNTLELKSVGISANETLNHHNSTTALHSPDVTSHAPSRFFDSTFCKVFLCFSLIRNTKKIFNTNVPATAITCINGIRVFSICWVILGHAFLIIIVSGNVGNKGQFVQDAKRLSVMPVINAYFAVDSFFFLSGLLVAYTCFRKMAKSNGKFNWVLFYVHRFWRLTPSYMFVILFTVHIKGLISNSYLWNMSYKDPNCEDKWWTNLLYINNFYPEEFNEQCIGWSWYLANDMQFFIISPLLLILAFKYGWRGLLASTGTMLLCSTIVLAALYGSYDLDPIVSLKLLRFSEEIFRKANEHNKYVYSKPYCRIQPYLVGFALGYAIYMKYRGPAKKRAWLTALIGWSVAFAIAMTLVYAPHESIVQGNREWNMTENIFYGTFQRLLWGLVLAWVTYACHNGYGSYVQQFLSARFWIPLSRLTYSVYLIHMIVLHFMLQAGNGPMYYDLLNASYYFIASIVLSYAAGYILAVVIEFPSENLENLILKLMQERRKSTV